MTKRFLYFHWRFSILILRCSNFQLKSPFVRVYTTELNLVTSIPHLSPHPSLLSLPPDSLLWTLTVQFTLFFISFRHYVWLYSKSLFHWKAHNTPSHCVRQPLILLLYFAQNCVPVPLKLFAALILLYIKEEFGQLWNSECGLDYGLPTHDLSAKGKLFVAFAQSSLWTKFSFSLLQKRKLVIYKETPYTCIFTHQFL